jgi:hypothetical protein
VTPKEVMIWIWMLSLGVTLFYCAARAIFLPAIRFLGERGNFDRQFSPPFLGFLELTRILPPRTATDAEVSRWLRKCPFYLVLWALLAVLWIVSLVAWEVLERAR